MRKTMRLLLTLFLSVFLIPVCGAAEPLTHEIDEQATAQALWKKGETITKDCCFDIKFLGITTQGYYLVQEFYSDSDEGKKQSDPYLSACPSEEGDRDQFWRACRKTGLLVRWHKNGKKNSEGHFQDDKQQGLWNCWHENGEKYNEGHFQEGKQQGLWVWWHENGQKYSEGRYQEGEPLGLWTAWHKNGQKAAEGHYQEGKQQGLWIWWDQNGNETDREGNWTRFFLSIITALLERP